MHRRRSKLIFLALSVLLVHVQSICYYPDGSVAPQDTPCDDTSTESTCCGQGYACLSNRICKATGEELKKHGASEFVRGSCTDKNWRSSSCPAFCVNPMEPNNDLTSGGMGIGKCDNSTDDIYYCIDANLVNVDCNNKVNIIFFQGTPTTMTIIGEEGTTSTSSTSATATNTATSSTVSTTPNASQILTSSQSIGSNPSGSSFALSIPQTTASEQPISGQPPITSIAVGASVGGLAFVLIILGVVYWRRRKRGLLLATETNRGAPTDCNGALEPKRDLATGMAELYSSSKGHEVPIYRLTQEERYELPQE